MLVEHKTAGGRAAPATGSGARDGFSAPPQPFSTAVQLDAGADRAVVMLRGELDLMGVMALVDCFAEIMPATHEIVLDFAELDFIDCSGLHAIATATHTAVAYGCSLRICSLRAQSQRLFDLVNFEQIVASHS